MLLLGILFLAWLPAATAEITLAGPEQTTFNFGDQVSIEGTILETADYVGFLRFELHCGESEVLATKSMTLRANNEKTFTQKFTVPQTLTGTCAINTKFESNGNTVAEADSQTFTIANTLNAPIIIDKELAQLGDSITLEGTITKLDGKPVDGLAKVFFRQEKNIIVQDTVAISRGKFSYTYETENNPAGDYKVEIEVTDINNNKQAVEFENVRILGNIGLNIILNDQEFLPGDKVKIEGTARTGESRITKGKAYITLDEQREETTILLGILRHTITLPPTIKTGEHTLIIDVEDDYGNTETQQYTITTIAVPTRLELALNQESFMPEQQITIKPTLYDQGDDIIATGIDLKVYDAEKDLVFADTVQSTEQTAFTFPRAAAPGEWRIKATALEIKSLVMFDVGEFKALDVSQESSTITFENTGNIPFKEKLTITMTDKNDPARVITKEKKVSLGVGKNKIYDLAYLAGQGAYTVQIGDKAFDTVEITRRRWAVMPYLATILGVVIVYLLFKLIKNHVPRRRRHHRIQHAHQQEQHHLHRSETQIRREQTQEYYEEKLKRDLAERMEAQRKKVHFSFKKRKDDYVMGLPKKRAKAATESLDKTPVYGGYTTSVEKKDEVISNNPDFFDPWKDEPAQEQKKEERKKGGLFGMFD